MSKEKQRGITLIALIITIIVILILVSTTIGVAISSGLFKHAINAGEMYKVSEYQDILGIIGMNVQIGQHGNNATESDYMEEYQLEIENDDKFYYADILMEYYEEELVIQVITEDDYVFWVRKGGVEYKGKKDEAELLKENTHVYASLMEQF